MRKKFKRGGDFRIILLAGFMFSLAGCGGRNPAKEVNMPDISHEKVIHIISVAPYPETAKESAVSVDIAYQDPETMEYMFFREDKRPCEFHPGEANLVIEKGKRSLILPNATCPDENLLPQQTGRKRI